MGKPDDLRKWVTEAIGTLGTMKPEATDKIVKAIAENLNQPPKWIALQLRKEGHQIEPAEKKKLGITAKSFFIARCAKRSH